MAFKIKSAKIFCFVLFFFGIKEHTVMLLLVVLPRLSTRRAATGCQQEEETRLCHTQNLQVDTGCGQRSRQEGRPAVTHSKQQKVRPGEHNGEPDRAGVTASRISL